MKVRTFVQIITQSDENRKAMEDEPESSPRKLRLVAYVGHQLLDFCFRVGGQRQERQAYRAAEVAVEIHGMLQARRCQTRRPLAARPWRSAPVSAGPVRCRLLSTRHKFHSRLLGRHRRKRESRPPHPPAGMVQASAQHRPALEIRLPFAGSSDLQLRSRQQRTDWSDGGSAFLSGWTGLRWFHLEDPASAPTETSSPPCPLPWLAAFSMRGVTASKVSVTVALRFTCRVPSTMRRTFSTSPLDSLMPMMLGWSASSMTSSAGMSYPVNGGTAVDHHRQRRPVGDGAVKCQNVRGLHLLLVIKRCAHQWRRRIPVRPRTP